MIEYFKWLIRKLGIQGSLILFIFLGVLLLGPSGGYGPLPILKQIVERVREPITQAEAKELDFLSCLEEAGSEIPNLSSVQKVLPDDGYLVQRVGDIYYPRVRFGGEESQFSFHVSLEPIDGKLISSSKCGEYFVGVIRNF